MEEFLTGELEGSPEAAERRSVGLIRELVPAGMPAPQLDVQELAATALRTIALKELSGARAGSQRNQRRGKSLKSRVLSAPGPETISRGDCVVGEVGLEPTKA
jgi:hypothetical protein